MMGTERRLRRALGAWTGEGIPPPLLLHLLVSLLYTPSLPPSMWRDVRPVRTDGAGGLPGR